MKTKFFIIGILLACSCNMPSYQEQARLRREHYVDTHREELQDTFRQYFIKEMRKEFSYRWASKADKEIMDIVLDAVLDKEEFRSSLEYQRASEAQKKEIDVLLNGFDKKFFEENGNMYVNAILNGMIVPGMTVEQIEVAWDTRLHLIFESSGGMSMYDNASHYSSSYSYHQSPYYTFTFDNGYLESWTKHGGW